MISSAILSIHAFFRALPVDFSDRWRHLREFSRCDRVGGGPAPRPSGPGADGVGGSAGSSATSASIPTASAGPSSTIPTAAAGAPLLSRCTGDMDSLQLKQHLYFGSHPFLLNVAESALLAGILPFPETLNPITKPRRGKYSQARVLRRMVTAGFIDLKTALLIEYDGDRKQIREPQIKFGTGKWQVSYLKQKKMEEWALRKNSDSLQQLEVETTESYLAS